MKKIVPYCITLLAFYSCGPSGADLKSNAGENSIKNLNLIQFDTIVSGLKVPDSVNIKNLWKDTLMDRLEHLIIDGKKYYVLETDILLDEKEYQSYLFYKRYEEEMKENMLTGEIMDGIIVKWDESDEISYCINRSSFEKQSDYDLVKANMLQATKDWENTCNIKFKYLPELDGSDIRSPNNQVKFVIKYIPDYYTNLIASAFFPYDKGEKRVVRVLPKYFTTSANTTGVLRHEIGHILGFRHEHKRLEATDECRGYPEKGTLHPVTEYDAKSVMHYLCPNAGTKELEITELDKKGAVLYYGKPL